VRAALAEVYDLERLVGRATLGVATPRDLVALRRSLERLPEIARALASRGDDPAGPDVLAVPELLGPREGADLCPEVAALIAAAVVDEPPLQWNEGGVIRRGHSDELDDLADIAAGGKEKLLTIEVRERERTDINSLKIRYNRIFDYYLEITKSNMSRVPTDYIRKQTLTTCERYTTPELTDYETRIVGADERRVTLELELFGQLRKKVAAHSERLQRLAEEVARLDVLSTLAEVHAVKLLNVPDTPTITASREDGITGALGSPVKYPDTFFHPRAITAPCTKVLLPLQSVAISVGSEKLSVHTPGRNSFIARSGGVRSRGFRSRGCEGGTRARIGRLREASRCGPRLRRRRPAAVMPRHDAEVHVLHVRLDGLERRARRRVGVDVRDRPPCHQLGRDHRILLGMRLRGVGIDAHLHRQIVLQQHIIVSGNHRVNHVLRTHTRLLHNDVNRPVRCLQPLVSLQQKSGEQ